LEFKNWQFEIKEINEKGIFKGVASPYNNVDLGNDRVLSTISKRNKNKTVPYLWCHDTKEPVGEVKLMPTDNSMDFEGKLYLDTNEQGVLLIPNAHKAYVLMKNGQVKNSIGYKTLDYEYVKEGNNTIRNLKDIDIMEVSAVIFPMNPKADITDVKQEGGNKVEVEEKAMGFADLLKVQNANELRWKLQDALNASFRALMEDDTMTIEQKITQLGANVDEFATAYKENMNLLLQASAKNKVAKKEVFDIMEKKEAAELETKSGKKISKLSMEKIKSAISALSGLIDNVEIEEEDDKGCSTKPGMKESTVVAETKQEPNENDIIELKSEELDEISKLYKTIKGGNK
jgi:HK97 family phage prohead protease